MRSIVFSLMLTATAAGSIAAQAQEQPAKRTSQPVARIESGPGNGDMAPNFRLPWASAPDSSADQTLAFSSSPICGRAMGITLCLPPIVPGRPRCAAPPARHRTAPGAAAGGP